MSPKQSHASSRPQVHVTFHPVDASDAQAEYASHHETSTTLAPGARWFFQALALAVFAFVVGIPSINGKFLPHDDLYVTQNPAIRAWNGLQPIWLTPQRLEAPYPVTFTSYLLQHRVFRDSPTGYRAINLALHAVATILLWTLLRKLELPGAWFAAAIFAVHPVQVASIAWIAQHKAVVCGVFFISSLLVYFRFCGLNPPPPEADVLDRSIFRLPTSRAVLYAISALLLLLAIGSQAIAVAFVPIVLISIWWKRGRIVRDDLRSLILPALLTFTAAVLFAVIEYRHGARGTGFPGMIERAQLFGYAVWSYLQHVVLPIGLAFANPRIALRPDASWQFIPTLAVIGLFIALWQLRRAIGRGPLAAAMLFAALVLPYSGLVNFKWMAQSFVGDHVLYLACAVPAIALATTVVRLRALSGFAALFAMSLIIAALGSISVARSRDYRDSKSLWTATLARHPRLIEAHNALGLLAMSDNNSTEALHHLREALDLDSQSIATHLNLARLYDSIGQPGEALGEYHQALRSDPNNADAHFGLATIYARQDNSRDAIRQYRKVLELRGDDKLAYLNLGRLHDERGEIEQAIACYREAIRIDARNAQARVNLALLMFRAGDAEAAMDEIRTVCERIDPNYFPAWMNAGAIAGTFAARQTDPRVKRGLYERAAEYYRVAAVVDRTAAEPHTQRGIVLMKQSRLEDRTAALRLIDDAIAAFKRAMQLNPDDPQPAQLAQAAQAERAARDAARATAPAPPVTRPTH